MQGTDWDTPVSQSLKAAWISFKEQLKQIEQIRIPRWFRTSSAGDWELHGFSDASERAYAAALYIVVRGDAPSAKLMAAKTKVAPIKVVSLPRLELCGAQLLANLIASVLSKLTRQPRRIHCWSDSKVVLAWLQSHPVRWKSFIANRVSEVITLLPTATWRHVASADNPSDFATRGLSPIQLRDSTLWWHGPSWLCEEESAWPTSTAHDFDTNLETRSKYNAVIFVAQTADQSFTDWCRRFSSVTKLVHILAYISRWRQNARLLASDRKKASLTAPEIIQGRALLIKAVQRESFMKEIDALNAGKVVPSNSTIKRLDPFIAADGILRVGGRLHYSYLSEEEKHPAIIPSKHHVTRLIIQETHLSSLHGGPLLVQSILFRRYWIVQGRNFIRKMVRACITCTRHKAATTNQQMAPLPAARSRPARPFTLTGLDYAGPFWVKASPGRGQKAYKGYVAIFTCMVTKATHIEVVSDYSSRMFLEAFGRFTARRGLPQVLYSDNGTTFQGADSELRRLFAETAAFSQEIAANIAKDGVHWTYIPPRAPHFGGLWEACVKSFKGHLKRVVGETRLTFEEFSTVTCHIEACLNSRPLSPFSNTDEDVAALTPGHFLIGSALLSHPEPFNETNETNKAHSRWKISQLMRNHFWQRWRTEFLSQLQQRSKWFSPNHIFKVGDVVIIRDELTPPTKWPLARIIELHSGRDGLNRVATVKTSTSQLSRALNKLILLPINQEASVYFSNTLAPSDQPSRGTVKAGGAHIQFKKANLTNQEAKI